MDNNISELGLARQPIFDKDLNVVAYELLYQTDKSDDIEKLLDGDQQACDVLINNYTSIYDAGALKSLPAFINVSQGFIRTESLPCLSRQNLVVEVKDLTHVTDELIDNLSRYASAGYRIVLDDFDYVSGFDPLLKIADIVRVDMRARRYAELPTHLNSLRRFNVTLLAENIENYQEYEYCQSQGFRLFQGIFLSRPTLMAGKKLSSNQAIVIHLLAALQDPEVTADTLADIISRDPQLIYKLLRIVNSAQYTLPHEVENLTQAVVALGLNEINKWATLLALSSNDKKPSELIRQILITARMCEAVAEQTEETSPELAFICGVLSILDALLDIDQQTLLEQLSVSEEVEKAIVQYDGAAGFILQAVNFYMVGKDSLDMPPEIRNIYGQAYAEALRWSNETMHLMEGIDS